MWKNYLEVSGLYENIIENIIEIMRELGKSLKSETRDSDDENINRVSKKKEKQ